MNGQLDLRCVVEREAFRLDVDLALPASGVTGVFGPSGSGKTTMLRVIAGLERPANAAVIMAGTPWQDGNTLMRPEHRRIGYVFQEPRLFPHLDVGANLAFAQRHGGSRAAELDVDAIVGLLGIGALLTRKVRQLSGGEAQRVAVARALLRAPQLLLMDEPLASLDRHRRDELLPFLDRLQAETEIPIVYVSHSMDEICRLSDHLVVLDDGRAVAEGPLQQVLVDAGPAILRGDDACAVIEGQVTEFDPADMIATVRSAAGVVRVAGPSRPAGRDLRLRIRASDVSLCLQKPAATSILNVLPATVRSLTNVENGMLLARLQAADTDLLARITQRSARELKLEPGTQVYAQIKSASIRNVPGSTSLDRQNEL